MMIPARHVPSMPGSIYGSSSSLTLGQPNLLEGQQFHHLQHQQHLVDMAQTTGESDILVRGREEDFESKSGSENIEGASGDDQDPNQRPKKKRYHRHTQHQIQEMEA